MGTRSDWIKWRCEECDRIKYSRRSKTSGLETCDCGLTAIYVRVHDCKVIGNCTIIFDTCRQEQVKLETSVDKLNEYYRG